MTILETRFRPPYNLFAGSIFFCWLFGSIFNDLYVEQNRDTALLILFGILFAVSLHLFVRSLRSLVFFNRTGLKITEEKITYIEPGWFSVKTTKINRSDVSETDVSKGSVLIRHIEGDLILRLNNFLLGPESIIHAIQSDDSAKPGFRERGSGSGDLEGVKCLSCGAEIRIDLNNRNKLKCDYCNNENPVPEKMSRSLKLLMDILSDIPENIRQLGKTGEGKLLLTGEKSMKGMRTSAYVTLGVWILFSLVEFLSSALRKGTDINYKFIAVSMALGIFTLLSALFLSFILEKIIKKLSFRYIADPMPGGKASCRLCGGELNVQGLICRCSYCGTDNIVDHNVLKEHKKEAGITLGILRERIIRIVSDTERIINITSDQLILLTATQFFWLHIPTLVLLDGSAGMIMKITPLFILFTLGAIMLLLKGFKELISKNSFDLNIN